MTPKPMTPRRRLLAAMRCEVPDRVPIQVRGVYPTDPEWLKTHHPSFRPLHDAVRDKCDPVQYVRTDNGWYGVARGTLNINVETRPVDEDWVEDVATVATPKGPLRMEYRRSLKGEPGFQTRHGINDEEELERFLSIPEAEPKGDVKPFFDAVARAGERGLVIADIGSNPIGQVHELLGSENLAVWSAMERESLKKLLRTVTARTERFVERLLDAGLGPVFATLGHEIALPPLLSPGDFFELVVENDKPFMHAIRSKGNLIHVHCHYNLRKVLDGFVELGVNCLHPVEAPPMGDIELADAKARLRGKVCIEGNMQIGDLFTLTPTEVRAKTRKIIEDAAAGGGLILCPTASPYKPVLDDETRDNYLAFIEAGLEFGRY